MQQVVTLRKSGRAMTLAHEIMGRNYFAVEDTERLMGIKSDKQFEDPTFLPFGEMSLRVRRSTYVLIPVQPISIAVMRETVSSSAFALFYPTTWCEREEFFWHMGEPAWVLLRKEPVGPSLSREAQYKTLDKFDYVPAAQTVIYCMLAHFLATGERLFKDTIVRCADVTRQGRQVYVGQFDEGGLHIGHALEAFTRPHLGLAAALRTCT